MTTLAIGTCRVYQPAGVMGDHIRTPRHRVHTLAEIEQVLAFLTGRLSPKLWHLVSRYALRTLVGDPLGARRLEGLRERNADLGQFDRFIIEVSSAREFSGLVGGKRRTVNSLVLTDLKRFERDLRPYYEAGRLLPVSDITVSTTSEQHQIAVMSRIRKRLDRPIIWVPHTNILDPDASEQKLYQTRRLLHATVMKGAAALGDQFFDPTAIVKEVGRAAVFRDEGRDLAHFSPLAVDLLAKRYNKLIGAI